MNLDIESEIFYNLMQEYRHTPIQRQDMAIHAYNKVKEYISIWAKNLIDAETQKLREYYESQIKIMQNR